jgi:tetratricopeptide (TPR) repeat protein
MLARPPAMEVFCVYAQSDIRMQKQLERHLAALRSADYISGYSACKIDGESKVAEALDERFNTAALILFLISPDYLKADGSHMLIQRLLERHARKEVCLIPILLRPANLAGTPYERLRVLSANGAPISVKRVWHNRDIAFNEIAIALRKIIEDITSAWRAEPALDAPIPLWNVPYPSNPYFTGREMLLAALHAGLRSGRIMALTPAPGSDAVAGGGIGKTQIAIEYAYRHAHDYEAVLWVDASSREALLRDFAALAEILDLPERNLADQESIVRAVRRWLEEHEHWLLIFDQADQPVRLLEFLTLKDSGCILLTSRAVALGTLLDAERLHVGPMDPEEAALFLLRRARILPLNSLLEDVHVVPRVGAREVAHDLDYLPLALDLAAAYIDTTGSTLEHYEHLYLRRRNMAWRRRALSAPDLPEPIIVAYALALERVGQSNPAAVKLLRLCAFLCPTDIPEQLFTQETVDLGPELEIMRGNSAALSEALDTLRAYGLLWRDGARSSFSLPRVVHALLKDGLGEADVHAGFAVVVRSVNTIFPNPEDSITWSLCKRYILHVQFLAAAKKYLNIAMPEMAQLLSKAGYYNYLRGQYAEAEALLHQAVSMFGQLGTPEHPGIVTAFTYLAHLYITLDRDEQAEPLLQRALTQAQAIYGNDHLEVARALNQLANFFLHRGKAALAETLLRRAISISGQAGEPDHLFAAQLFDHLALALINQDKGEQAEAAFGQALRLYESEAPGDPGLARTLNHLADFYGMQGRYAEAERCLRRALAIFEQAYGPEHPEVAHGLNNLAIFYASQGRCSEAEELLSRALILYERAFGLHHPDIAYGLSNLAACYNEQNRLEAVEPLYQRALAIMEQAYGPEHEQVALLLETYTDFLRKVGRERDAMTLSARSRAIRVRLRDNS